MVCAFAGTPLAVASCFLPGPNLSQNKRDASGLKVATMETSFRPSPTQEWDVDRYQSQHDFVWEYGSSLVDLVAESIGDSERHEPYSYHHEQPLSILDAGCGSGELTQELKLLFPSFTVQGMDADPSMVQKASTQFPDLKFFQQDFRTLALDNDDKYDVIFSNAALHWVPPKDAELAVESLARALRPGGHLVVEFGGKGNVRNIVRATQSAIQEMGCTNVEPFWYFPSVAEFCTLLEKHGIEVTSAELYDRPTPLKEGQEGMSNWLRMFGSKLMETLNPDQTEVVLQKVDEALKPTHLWNGGHWIADYRRLRVTGIKTRST